MTGGRVLLFSGGLDSVCVWRLAGYPTPVYVRLGHAYERAEMATLERLAAAVPGLAPVVVDGPDIGRHAADDGHIPHRNAALITTVAAELRPAEVLLGALLGEASPDKSRRFTRAMGAALSASGGRAVRVSAPARRLTKTGLVRRYLAAEPDHGPRILGLTRSCYATAGECGDCPACFRRHVALWHVGLRAERPRLPATATASAAWRGARGAGLLRAPALVVNNAGAAAALAGVRLGRRLW